MIPIGDDNLTGGPPPLVNWALIALNVAAFFLEISQPSERALQSFITAWGVVPREYSSGHDIAPLIPLPFWSTLITSMFLHGGWMHLGGNMLYLWIFGDNLNKVMGQVRYFLFYIVCGLAAGLAHIAFNSGSGVPSVGASGAISGVLGGYMVLFPRNRVRVMMRGGITAVPAYVMLGLWILIQIVSGAMDQGGEGGGVAFMAHIGGFAAGLVLVKLFAAGRTRPSYA
ncbi:MAG TPA: rhomboid family intramembrane serine protease [Vicinamibacteria bacterium]|nr:rhomboid family intramembrane serine protease [Vicinamibacteria bacterium]